MTCPHCAHFQETTLPELKKRYIDTGKVRYIFREFPLDTLASAAFMLARCAGEKDQSKIFRHDRHAVPPADPSGWSPSRCRRCSSLPSRPASPSRLSTPASRIRSCSTASKRASAGHRRVQGAVDTDLFHQRRQVCGGFDHRADGPSDRPATQGRIRVFRTGAALAAQISPLRTVERSGKPRAGAAQLLLQGPRRFIVPTNAVRAMDPRPGQAPEGTADLNVHVVPVCGVRDPIEA